MSRRRSVNPTKAISVTLPQLLLRKLDFELDYSQSRSKWIANACEEKLTNNVDLNNWTPLELVEHLQFKFKPNSPEDVLIVSLLQILSKQFNLFKDFLQIKQVCIWRMTGSFYHNRSHLTLESLCQSHNISLSFALSQLTRLCTKTRVCFS